MTDDEGNTGGRMDQETAVNLKCDVWGGATRPDKTDNQIADAIQQSRQCAARFWKRSASADKCVR